MFSPTFFTYSLLILRENWLFEKRLFNDFVTLWEYILNEICLQGSLLIFFAITSSALLCICCCCCFCWLFVVKWPDEDCVIQNKCISGQLGDTVLSTKNRTDMMFPVLCILVSPFFLCHSLRVFLPASLCLSLSVFAHRWAVTPNTFSTLQLHHVTPLTNPQTSTH